MEEKNKINGKILFVDEDKRTLKALKRSLFQSEMETFFVNSYIEAQQFISEHDIDILVTDVQLLNTGGIDLLNFAKRNYPQVHRMILSGHVEKKLVLSVLNKGLASAYIAKPWDDKILLQRLEHLLNMFSVLKNKKLLGLLKQIDAIPTFSSLYLEFINAVEDGKSIDEITAIIGKDISASSKLLKVANSAFYGGKRVSSLNQAIVKLGLMEVKSVFLTLSIISSMNWKPEQIHFLEDVFAHSSVVNSVVAQMYKIKEKKYLPVEYSSVGVMHDLGKIIMIQYFFEDYQKIMTAVKKYPDKDFYQVEIDLDLNGITHCEVGAFFIDAWNLPDVFMEAALFHHSDGFCASQKDYLYYLNIANKLVTDIEKQGNIDELDFYDYDDWGFSDLQILEVSENILVALKSSRISL